MTIQAALDDQAAPGVAALTYHATGGKVGQSYLERRSELARRLSERPGFKSITIIDDVQFDADVLSGTLRRVLGREIDITTSRSIMALHKLWEAGMPDLVFMDDRIGHIGTAATHVPVLRKMGYLGPIVVVSGLMTRERRAQIIQLGAVDMLHKDDLDTLTVMELLLRLLGARPAADEGGGGANA